MRQKLSVFASVVVFCPSVTAVQAGPVEFKFAHFVNSIEPGPESGLWIEKDVNEKISDKVNAQYFHSGQVGSAIEIVKKAKAREQGKQLTIDGDTLLNEKGIAVTELAPEEMAKFKEKQMKVWDQFEGDIGKQWLDKIKALSASLN